MSVAVAALAAALGMAIFCSVISVCVKQIAGNSEEQ